MLRSIIVPLDGSPLAERALPFALTLARSAKAQLIVLHARWLLAGEGDPVYDLEPIAAQLRLAGATVTTALRLMPQTEDAGQVILDVAHGERVDLIVMSTHEEGGLSRLVYGSVADHVVREADVPVLLIPARAHHTWPTDRPLKVLVPLDGSLFSEMVLGPVRDLAVALSAEVTLLKIIEFAIYADVARYVPNTFSTELTATTRYLHEAEKRADLDMGHTEVRTAIGDPATLIAKLADQEAFDLIAMTTHSRSGIARALLGSVATQTLQLATLPVLLVHPGRVTQTDLVTTSRGEATPG